MKIESEFEMFHPSIPFHEPELGAPASLPACRGVGPETRRQGCRRSQSCDRFMAPMRDLGIVETTQEPLSQSGAKDARTPNAGASSCCTSPANPMSPSRTVGGRFGKKSQNFTCVQRGRSVFSVQTEI